MSMLRWRDGWTPLHTAASRRQTLRIIELLVGFGADVNAKVEGSGWTPLHGAIMEKDKASVEYLIAHKADLNLAASKRDVAKGAKLTPRELALEIKFEPMSVFDGAPELSPEDTPSPPSNPTPPPPPATEGVEKKVAYTEAELEAMIQARLESQVASQVEKALSAKMAEIMKMNEGSAKKAETPRKEEKSSEDREVEAAMERMRADEAKDRGQKSSYC